MNKRVSTIIAGLACTPQYRRAQMGQYPEYADKITGEEYGGGLNV